MPSLHRLPSSSSSPGHPSLAVLGSILCRWLASLAEFWVVPSEPSLNIAGVGIENPQCDDISLLQKPFPELQVPLYSVLKANPILCLKENSYGNLIGAEEWLGFAGYKRRDW